MMRRRRMACANDCELSVHGQFLASSLMVCSQLESECSGRYSVHVQLILLGGGRIKGASRFPRQNPPDFGGWAGLQGEHVTEVVIEFRPVVISELLVHHVYGVLHVRYGRYLRTCKASYRPIALSPQSIDCCAAHAQPAGQGSIPALLGRPKGSLPLLLLTYRRS